MLKFPFLVTILYLITGGHTYCVYNKGCKDIHAELWQRDQGLFSGEFSKKITVGNRECCNPSSSGCIRGTKDDALLWIDCDTDSRNKKGYGQAVVACGDCDVNVYDSGMIEVVVAGGGDKGKVLSVYACKGTDAALSPSRKRDKTPL